MAPFDMEIKSINPENCVQCSITAESALLELKKYWQCFRELEKSYFKIFIFSKNHELSRNKKGVSESR